MPALGLIPREGARREGESRKAFNQRRFLICFAECAVVATAARWAKVAKRQHFEWMHSDRTYPARFAEARRQAAQALEDEAVRRAREGARRPIMHRGKQCRDSEGNLMWEYEYSDQLLTLLLRANDPERFRERVENRNINEIDWENAPEELLEKIAMKFLSQAFPNDPGAAAEARRQLEAGEPVLIPLDDNQSA